MRFQGRQGINPFAECRIVKKLTVNQGTLIDPPGRSDFAGTSSWRLTVCHPSRKFCGQHGTGDEESLCHLTPQLQRIFQCRTDSTPSAISPLEGCRHPGGTLQECNVSRIGQEELASAGVSEELVHLARAGWAKQRSDMNNTDAIGINTLGPLRIVQPVETSLVRHPHRRGREAAVSRRAFSPEGEKFRARDSCLLLLYGILHPLADRVCQSLRERSVG